MNSKVCIAQFRTASKQQHERNKKHRGIKLYYRTLLLKMSLIKQRGLTLIIPKRGSIIGIYTLTGAAMLTTV